MYSILMIFMMNWQKLVFSFENIDIIFKDASAQLFPA